jgi:hypothetical protein
MGVAVSIVFTGLCALVTGGDRAPGQVLLVDTNGVGKVAGIELPAHAPTLVVSLSSLANAETSSPTRVVTAWPGGSALAAEQLGVWDLKGSEVSIRVQGEQRDGIDLSQERGRASSWPEPPRNANDPESWRDLRFVADMRALAGDARIDQALVETDAAHGDRLPHALSARIHLNGGRLEAGMPSQETHRDDIFEFRAVGSEPRLRQALTDTIQWSLESDAAAVLIEIAPIAGGPVKRLVLTRSAVPHRLFVSNLPAENGLGHAHDMLADNDLAALHFGVYYELLRSKPTERPLPRLWVPAAQRRATGVMGPIICPPALFFRD